MELKEALDSFTSQDIADALYSLGETTAGSKAERTERLVKAFRDDLKGDLAEFLERFTMDALRGACDNLGVERGRTKAEVIKNLLAVVSISDQPSVSETKPAIKPTGKETVISVLKDLKVPRRKARNEEGARDELASNLKMHFEDVVIEYNIGGYFGLRIDLDIGNGKFGIEVKLAEAIATAVEAHRLIGQAVYYQKRRYGDNLAIAVVGGEDELREPGVRETLSFLADLGITTVSVAMI